MQRVQTVFLVGRETQFIQVELAKYRGIPQIVVVGLATKMVTEAKERLKSALKYVGVKLPHCRYVINLTPAGLVKKSTNFDLAMAVAFLGELQLLDSEIQLGLKELWVGELGLDGRVKPIIGILEIVLAAKKAGYTDIWCAQQSLTFLGLVDGITVHGITHIRELIKGLARQQFPTGSTTTFSALRAEQIPLTKTLSSLEWNSLQNATFLKRAVLIAAAGWHHLCLIGPPGFGKTTVARLLVDLLPPPSNTELLELIQVASLQHSEVLLGQISRPVRMPGSSITASELLGGGRQHCLGEVALAHRGVLFLDEFTDFSTARLESLKPILESGVVLTASGMSQQQCRFICVAAANPCRCGKLGSSEYPCTCAPHSTQPMLKKVSAAWFDRIDVCVRVQPKKTVRKGESTMDMDFLQVKKIVEMAWQKQQRRWGQESLLNGMVQQAHQVAQLALTTPAERLIDQVRGKLQLLERSVGKVVKVARTIDDLGQDDGGKQPITSTAVAEALQYRSQLIFS